MPSQWLAVDAGTDLRARARQIQRSWESLLAGGALNTELSPQATAELRPAIVDSWRRSLATGLDPTDLLPSIEADPSETRERWLEHPLGSFRHVLASHLQRLAQESNSLVQVTDPSGLTLHLDGPEWLKARAAEMNLVEGARCAETVNGTNGVGTALAANRPVQVFAFEHFSHHHREWVCSGAPVHDPVSGRLVGILDLSSPWRIAHPRSLELVTLAAKTLEECLFQARRDHDARLRRRYGDLATRSTDLLVNGEGYVLIGDLAHPTPFDVPENGGEVSMGDGSLAVAQPLGLGEAYLLRRLAPARVTAAPAEVLEHAKGRVHEQPREHDALRCGGDQTAPVRMNGGGTSIESDSRASAYLEAALDCVIIADASGRVVEFNPAAERTFGYTRDEALGRTMAELIVPPSLRDRHITAFARYIENHEGRMLGRRLQLTGMRADGSEFPVELTLSQVEAEPTLICGALRDISEAKQAESHLRELADEQAALRRVATLVAHESSPQQLFAIVAEQVAQIINVPLVRLFRYESDGSSAELIGGWGERPDPLAVGTRWPLDEPVAVARVWQSGRPARLDDYTQVPGQAAAVAGKAGMRSAVASPITVDGRLWGAIAVLSPHQEPLPENTEARLADFTELVATAIANAESRAAIARLADEQAALRRVATLVARGVRPVDVFSAVSQEVQRLFGLLGTTLDVATVVRFDPGPEFILVGAAKSIDGLPLETRWGPNDLYVSTRVHRTGRSARVDEADLSSVGGPEAETLRRQGLISQVGSPIIVEGHLWGAVTVNATEKLPLDTEERLEKFTELVATAIANTDSRAELAASEGHARTLAEEQAALRRVATLVAEGAGSDELFAAVTREAADVLDVPVVALQRYEPERMFTMVAIAGETELTVGSRWPVEDEGLAGMVLATGGPATKQDYTTMPGPLGAALRNGGLSSAVGVPIVVEGSIWGFMTAGARPGKPIPDGTEERLSRVSVLVATAIADSHSREQLARLAYEQAALRRVATLVADGAKSDAVFSAVAHEVAHVFGVQHVTVCRYEPDAILVLSSFEAPEPTAAPPPFPAGHRLPLDVPSLPALVHRTGEPARIDDFSASHGLYVVARRAGLTAAVGVPIVVDGTVWGAVNVASTKNVRFPPDAEERLARFTELIATSISNATMREELAASRARVIAASDETRRRIERDLHDGAQQQLVTLAVGLRATKERVPPDLEELQADLAHTADGLTVVLDELREISRGIHPAILTEGGLGPALKALARRSGVPVEVDVRCDRRLAEGVEVAAYYVVSEALTNAAKHAQASRVRINVHLDEATLDLSIRDDGVGGADASRGSGLIGLRDRVEALGGTTDIASRPGSGTRLDVRIPLRAEASLAANAEPLSRV